MVRVPQEPLTAARQAEDAGDHVGRPGMVFPEPLQSDRVQQDPVATGAAKDECFEWAWVEGKEKGRGERNCGGRRGFLGEGEKEAKQRSGGEMKVSGEEGRVGSRGSKGMLVGIPEHEGTLGIRAGFWGPSVQALSCGAALLSWPVVFGQIVAALSFRCCLLDPLDLPCGCFVRLGQGSATLAPTVVGCQGVSVFLCL